MPFKTDKEKLDDPILDSRVRLLPCQRERMPEMRKLYGLSYNKLAELFGVSKRLAMFVCNPEKYETAKEQFKERRKDGRYYDRQYNTDAIRHHRRKKYNLLKDIKNETKD